MKASITGRTELIGLFAYPIRHSNSPAMHNLAFAKLGLDYVYLAFEVGRGSLAGAIEGLRAMKMRGANVSMPNKTVVARYLDKLSPAAELCGAVNTIVNDGGVLTGYITDGIGYMAALRDNGIDMTGEKMTLIGGGGAATAIAIQAALEGVAEISVFNAQDSFWERAQAMVEKINCNTSCRANLYPLSDHDRLRREIAGSRTLANATGVGMKPQEGMCLIPDASYLFPQLIVTDVVYAPRRTPLLEMARSVGCKYMNGMGMMLFQGAAAFQLWTGQSMPIEYMKEALEIQYGE